MGAASICCLVLFIGDLVEEPVEFALSCQRRQVPIKQHGSDPPELVHTPRGLFFPPTAGSVGPETRD